jgi:hypothetical protein
LRVTGQIFSKDCFHTTYNIKKTHGGRGGSRTAAYHSSGGTSFAYRDIPESSKSGGKRKNKKFAKMAEWLKAIFTTCTYAANTAYEDRLESQEAIREARELAGLHLFHLFGLHLSFLIFLACLTLPQRMRSNKSDRAAMMVVVVVRAYMQQRLIQLFRRPCFMSTPGDREILRQLVLPLSSSSTLCALHFVHPCCRTSSHRGDSRRPRRELEGSITFQLHVLSIESS